MSVVTAEGAPFCLALKFAQQSARSRPDDLQPHRVTAHMMHAQAARDFFIAVAENSAASEEAAHHRHDIVFVECPSDDRARHGPAGAESRLTVLDVIPGGGKQVVISAMVVMHVGDQHVLDFRRVAMAASNPLSTTMTRSKRAPSRNNPEAC